MKNCQKDVQRKHPVALNAIKKKPSSLQSTGYEKIKKNLIKITTLTKTAKKCFSQRYRLIKLQKYCMNTLHFMGRIKPNSVQLVELVEQVV